MEVRIETEGERERERDLPLTLWFAPQMVATANAGPGQSQELLGPLQQRQTAQGGAAGQESQPMWDADIVASGFTLYTTTPSTQLIQLPANVSERAVEDGSSTWVPDTQVGNLDAVSGFWSWPGSSLGCSSHLGPEPIHRFLCFLTMVLSSKQIISSLKKK